VRNREEDREEEKRKNIYTTYSQQVVKEETSQAVPVLLPHLATPICEKTTTSRLGFSCFPRDYVTLIPLTLLNPTAVHILQIPKDTTMEVHFIYVYKIPPLPLYSP